MQEVSPGICHQQKKCICCHKMVYNGGTFKTSCVQQQSASVSANLKYCCVVTWTLMSLLLLYHSYVNALCGGLSANITYTFLCSASDIIEVIANQNNCWLIHLYDVISACPGGIVVLSATCCNELLCGGDGYYWSFYKTHLNVIFYVIPQERIRLQNIFTHERNAHVRDTTWI